MTHKKIKGMFYPLQSDELFQSKENGLITNAGFVYYTLKLKNPWGDRPIEIDPKQLAKEIGIPESSVYDAIAKLKRQNLITIQSGKTVIQWVNGKNTESEDEFQNSETDVEILEPIQRYQDEFQDPRMDSEILESITKSQNELRDLRIHSEILESDIYKESRALDQTIQTYTDSNQTVTDPAATIENPYQLSIEKNINTNSTEILIKDQEFNNFSVENKSIDKDQSFAARNTLVTCNVVCDGEIITSTDLAFLESENPLAIPPSDEERQKYQTIYKIKNDWTKQPWRKGKYTYKPEVLDSLFKSNPSLYTDSSGGNRQEFMINCLNKLERELKGSDLGLAIAAYDKLMRLAVEATPEVKAVIEDIEKQKKEQERLARVARLREICADEYKPQAG